MKPWHNQFGFSAIEVALAFIVMGLVGGTGAYVIHANQQTDQNEAVATSAVTSKAANNATTDTNNFKQLANKAVSFSLPDAFTPVEGRGGAKDCYKAVDVVATCLDSSLLIVDSEGDFNSDQFQVLVSVFQKDNPKLTKEWFTTDLGEGFDTEHTFADFKANGLTGLKYVAPYANEQRVTYALSTNKYGVTVYTSLFKGNHYSYENNIDYGQYADTVEKLAQSITIKQ